LDIPPVFDIPEYKGINIKSQPVQVSDKDVDEAIDRLREGGARYEEVKDRPVRSGDLVRVDFEGAIEGQPLETVAPGAKGLGKATDFWVVANEHAFIPAFGEALTGLSVGDTKAIEVTFEDTFAEKALAGKKAVFQTTVKSIREKILKPLDDEFLKTMEVASLDELKKRIRDDLAAMRQRDEKARQRGDLQDQLLTRIQFDVPESEIQSETRSILQDMVRHQTQRGASQELLTEHSKELFESAKSNAISRL
jgi:trigger factor